MTTGTTGDALVTTPSPYWPPTALDLDRIKASYDVLADELLVYFDRDRPSGGVCDPIELAEGRIAVVYDWDTGEIIGIQGIPFLLGAVRYRPTWAELAWGVLAGKSGEQTLRQALPAFVEEVANSFRRYGLAGIPLDDFAAGGSASR